ncbi:PepSY domain-containing protein [Pseudidiomarina terrestris]|uniref:PepSY domain-containing protein n=1 Tax=Pseudidiomarina terrestris TaxID=2820060 RepID=A0AAW7R1A5_9GAMM|nr:MULTISPECIES: PepSY domain-containing protein [unclassified Pseudidiomarina]MDN7124893.1 PepSY domain-containing protein [Pseudidiomarina sp. 1APP75-32.1]MDN7125966.1 PepSY domain-containing protein [Pseudidiomarina sp. 1APR75-33.1]MDN7129634.1 PepSY domain-containing protein [Pseudidiomarina sp. 1APR75-15]MDN7135949.1 PepSY domain-containing protein [Pseudidiomarina sp. 1ASP75-5]MDN7138113.1 PepSY domain-containing protein [Pseudidiomarina sp. 1ASP75-14]
MKALKLLTLAAAAGLIAACSPAKEVTQCTVAPMSDWQDQAEFQMELVNQGYEINEFKITEGNCYEIYGTDADGNKVEVYFNPVDGEVIKREVH